MKSIPTSYVDRLVMQPYAHNYRIAIDGKTVALVSYGGEDIMAEAVRAYNEKFFAVVTPKKRAPKKTAKSKKR